MIDFIEINNNTSISEIAEALDMNFDESTKILYKGTNSNYGFKIYTNNTFVYLYNNGMVKHYSRLVYALVLGGIVDNFALHYACEHESIPALDDFRCDDEIWEAFVDFAMTQKFDYRSQAKTLFDEMRKELREDGLEDAMKAELEAMDRALNMEKEQFIRLKKDEIVPFIEEELAVRYYFQRAGVRIRLRYDDQLRQALRSAVLPS